MTSEQLMKIYDDIDTSGDGEIEYSEFIAAAMNKAEQLTDDNLVRAFKLISHGNDTINLGQL